MCDRSLATAVLYNQCPRGRTEAALRVLAECPPEMGFSYPANAGWRLWALGKGGRADVIVKDCATLGHIGFGEAQQHTSGGLARQARFKFRMEPLPRGSPTSPQ